MNRTLIIRTPNGDFDLYEGEQIVQTSSIFNLKDITSRSGDYTNEFSMPLTNNNRSLIEFADFVPSINTLPYKKLTVEIIIDELTFKTGFIEITGINESINAKFYSGNSVFYDLVKSIYVNDLDWSQYDHIWNLSNAVASSVNLYGYVYPIINYNGQVLAGDVLDVRYVLPSTYLRTVLDLMYERFGYTAIYNFDTSDLDCATLPFANKNPIVSDQVILDNSVDGSNDADFGVSTRVSLSYDQLKSDYVYSFDTPSTQISQRIRVNIFAAGTGSNWNSIGSEYNTVIGGIYNYTLFLDMINTDPGIPDPWRPYTFSDVDPADISSTSYPDLYIGYHNTEIRFIRNIAGTETVIDQVNIGSASTITGSIQLNQGDTLYVLVVSYGNVIYKTIGGVSGSFFFNASPTIKQDCTLLIEMQPELIFGGQITYSLMLPKIKCSDFLRDQCIRFGFLLDINEDSKTINLRRFDDVTKNIPINKNWTLKRDKSKKPDIKFKYDTYAQLNYFKHKEDKSVINTPNGSEYNLVIQNKNLESKKDFYISPFGVTENNLFFGEITSYINLYDTSENRFNKNVQPRILFTEQAAHQFKFTDGTTTSSYINAIRCWFIDQDIPQLCMGFGISLIDKNSKTIVNTLQNLRIVTDDYNLNIIDVKGIDYFIPIYDDEYQSYFFISLIKDFNYTSHQLTEVELIKLN